MLILHGVYHFGRKKIGARKDFCNACERECVAEQWESFDWGHVFFIPILPLGTRRRWRCSLCGKDPRARYKTNKVIRILGIFVLPVLFVPAWFVDQPSQHAHPSDAYFPYVMTLIFGSIWLWLLYSTFFQRAADTPNEERRAAVGPLNLGSCLYCGGPVALHPDPHCPACGVRFYAESRQSPPPPPFA